MTYVELKVMRGSSSYANVVAILNGHRHFIQYKLTKMYPKSCSYFVSKPLVTHPIAKWIHQPSHKEAKRRVYVKKFNVFSSTESSKTRTLRK